MRHSSPVLFSHLLCTEWGDRSTSTPSFPAHSGQLPRNSRNSPQRQTRRVPLTPYIPLIMPVHSPIPDIPGTQAHPNIAHHLSARVSELCGLRENRFPGAQPVSFTSASLELLERMDFWVCEKSDGVRLLIFVVMNGMTGNQEVWLVSHNSKAS